MHASTQLSARNIAETVLAGFERHISYFLEIARRAKNRFEKADWAAAKQASHDRVQFYDQRVDEAIKDLTERFEVAHLDEKLWLLVKRDYVQLIQEHKQPELAETFYNSVFCRMFHRRYFNNDYIFVRSAVSTEYIESSVPAYHVHYPAQQGLRSTIKRILLKRGFSLPFEDIDRDVKNIVRAICHRKSKRPRRAHLDFQLQIVNSVFYRNKAAYIIGKAINGFDVIPFAVPIVNNEKGALVADALLLGEDAFSQLFEFSYVYFMVDHPVPSSIVRFLGSIMPTRTKEDLYSSIGYHKQAKTDFYRDFLHHLDYSEDQLILAPGVKGMVMSVFTLPSYPYVFKVIRDKFAPPKETDRKTVEAKYQLVKQHDRVGRMADMMEYSYVALPINRFADDLLDELRESCASSIDYQGDKLVIKHIYIERRMVPLNIAVQRTGEYEISALMRGYGEAIKELAAANIFPGDLLLKNFGVTQQGRIVFYDYDEVSYLTDCNFRNIPEPRTPEDEMSAEPWYSIAPNDVFPEEFPAFLFADPKARKVFMEYHADLFSASFWKAKQENISNGIFEDVFPYPPSVRFIQSSN